MTHTTSAAFPSVNKRALQTVITPPDAWQRLRDMQTVVAQQPAIEHALRCLPLHDLLELQLELLHQSDWPDIAVPEPMPPNVIRFRRRRR
jgi:hypothetical protein